jgi:hypothetical protein
VREDILFDGALQGLEQGLNNIRYEEIRESGDQRKKKLLLGAEKEGSNKHADSQAGHRHDSRRRRIIKLLPKIRRSR